MKRLTLSALVLCIAMMCAGPQMAQGQNRRNAESNGVRRENVQRQTSPKQQPASRQSQPAQRRQVQVQQPRQPQAQQRQIQQQRQQPQVQRRAPQRPTQGIRPQTPAMRPAPARPAPAVRPAPPRPAPASTFCYGYRAEVLPHGAYKRVYNGVNYYFVNNVFYRPYDRGYVVCRPPVGATFAHAVIGAALTALIIRDAIDNSRYYYNNGVYYTRRNDRYTVVAAPVGALVGQLPDGYQEVVIDGNIYYQVDNVLYKTTVYSGLPYFEVAAVL